MLATDFLLDTLPENSVLDFGLVQSSGTQITTPQSAPVVEIESIPSDLERLIKRSLSENDLTPIIKETLKQKIQHQRAVDGKEPMQVKFEEPKQYELTQEEKEKIDKRKKRNRQSAHKSRVKRRCYEEQLEMEIKQLESDQEKLKKEVQMISDFEKKLRERFSNHMIKCTTRGNLLKAAGIQDVRQAILQRQQGSATLPAEQISNQQQHDVGAQQQPTTSVGVGIPNNGQICDQIAVSKRRVPTEIDLKAKLLQLAMLQQKMEQGRVSVVTIPERDIPVQQEICIDLG